jgi:hypothetical protein
LLRIRASGPSENAFAKPYARSSEAVKSAATRLPSLGPDGPPLTAWLRFALWLRGRATPGGIGVVEAAGGVPQMDPLTGAHGVPYPSVSQLFMAGHVG